MSAPEVFQLSDEDGHSYVITEVVPPGAEDGAVLGARSCPERAITIDP